MSYSITGVPVSSVDVAFYPGAHASGGSIHPPLTTTTVDHDPATLSTTNATKAVTTDTTKVDATPHTAAPVDTVTLSTSDKVRELRQQGAGDTQIAAALNLPVQEVRTDLHVQTQTQQHVSFTVAPVVAPLSAGVAAPSGQTVSANA